MQHWKEGWVEHSEAASSIDAGDGEAGESTGGGSMPAIEERERRGQLASENGIYRIV